MAFTYKDAGVDIDAGNEAVKKMKNYVQATFRKEVLTELGGFSGLFALNIKKYKEPVLVSGTDGVGTKLKVAMLMNQHSTIGIDAVAMCVNDILAQGAEPLFFLDYIAVGKLNPDKVANIVKGVAAGCLQAGCSLIGGETAEMPGFYGEDEYDIAGFAVGVVDKSKIISGNSVKAGEVLIGLSSTGLHSNGYSLARKVLLDGSVGYKIDTNIDELGMTIGEAMLTPTRIYVKDILPLLDKVDVKALAHITGGGLVENLPRVFPKGLKAVIDTFAWSPAPIFGLLQKTGNIAKEEMFRVFNMGVGMVVIVPANQANLVLSLIPGSFVMGEMQKTEAGQKFVLLK